LTLGLLISPAFATACSPSTTTSGAYTIATFTALGECTMTFPTGETNIYHYLVIAGGGGGGGYAYGGGGGAGGMLSGDNYAIGSITQYVTIGDGGAGGSSVFQASNASQGQKSAFANTTPSNGLQAVGGGGGIGYMGAGGYAYPTANGGSGAAGAGTGTSSVIMYGGSNTAGQGYSDTAKYGQYRAGGGGAGAGGSGGNGDNTDAGFGGSGGGGATWSVPGGGTYAGGGGGGTYTGTVGAGGSGGGGHGGNSYGACVVGTTNSGSGGGGAGHPEYPTGCKGGSGVVILWYLTNAVTPPTAHMQTAGVTGVYSADDTAGAYGNTSTTITFKDTSTNTPTSWFWNFGDSQTSVAQNPTHTYACAANSCSFNVAHGAQNAGGYGNVTVTGDVIIYHDAAPTLTDTITNQNNAGFLYGNTSTLFQFAGADTSLVKVDVWLHTFTNGGGGTSSSQTVTSKTFSVSTPPSDNNVYDTLTGTNYTLGVGTAATSGTPIVIYSNLSPTVTFTGTPTSGTRPLSVTFTATQVGSIKIDAWSWTFGDSNTSTSQNPTNLYSQAGTFTVSLTATNYSLGITTFTLTNYITVTNPAPVANFACTPLTTVRNGTITCTDSSSNTPTSWDWYSTTSGGTQQLLFSGNNTNQNPKFFPHKLGGYYSLCLIAANGGGSNTYCTGAHYIWVSKPLV
jgi:PKD repeat protein